MAKILTALYLVMMLAAGWRLFGLGWSRGVKIVTAVAVLLPLPLLLILPALMQPQRPFADLLRAIGLALLVCGALCIAGGWSAAWLRARRR